MAARRRGDAKPDEATPVDESRRDFLRKAGIGAAGVAIGGSAGAAITAAATTHPPEFAPLSPRHTPGFDHIVVVMFENRSFDNLLGRLYTARGEERRPSSTA